MNAIIEELYKENYFHEVIRMIFCTHRQKNFDIDEIINEIILIMLTNQKYNDLPKREFKALFYRIATNIRNNKYSVFYKDLFVQEHGDVENIDITLDEETEVEDKFIFDYVPPIEYRAIWNLYKIMIEQGRTIGEMSEHLELPRIKIYRKIQALKKIIRKDYGNIN